MKVLFVCTGNTCRSPMAEAIMNKIAEENDMNVSASSAGIMAEENVPASENAVTAMSEMNIDISGHLSHQATEADIAEADIILTMTAGQKMLLAGAAPEKIYTLCEFAGSGGDISDPYGGDLDEYRETAQEIYDEMVDVAEKLEDIEENDNN